MEFNQIALALAAGFVAGIINTLAGSGSLFTLPFLLFMGLSPHHANGTNRVGILAQTLVGAITLYKRGNVKLGKDAFYILPTVFGSALGALIAVGIDEEVLRLTIGIVMLALLVVIMMRYNELLRPSDEPMSTARQMASWPLLFAVGVYGGFIQLGVGIFTLAVLLLVMNFTFQHANALKNIMNFFLTLPAFLIFAWNGHIIWEIGAVIAIGQTLGAWVAARYAAESKSAAVWVRRLLVVMILITSAELFGLLDHLKSIF
jgi:uncharacterized membrane protein YfcA